eukprot:7098982-Prymnesium_polylepis.1
MPWGIPIELIVTANMAQRQHHLPLSLLTGIAPCKSPDVSNRGSPRAIAQSSCGSKSGVERTVSDGGASSEGPSGP